jgi:dihydrofolate synthase / folylpolyglutamate synthase
MTFSQAESYLLGTINESLSRRVPYRLERMRTLLRLLGNPQDRYPTLHVGGTSGKGSTATMLAAALTAAGKRAGLHTKPHLQSITERARIDGTDITQERFAELLEEMMPSIEATTVELGRPSYYETLLALAFVYFAREHVDAAVIEVGLGGTLDGTNVITPQVSVITNVGYDHTDVLGDTLEAIATEKAGIAKPGVPLITAVEDSGARRIIEERCAQVGAPFVSVLDLANIDARAGTRFWPQPVQEFIVHTDRAAYQITLPALGIFQRLNAATAIVALERLPGEMQPSPEAIQQGLSRVALPGRMEIFPGHPAVLFDVAHNPDKAQHLVASVRELFASQRIHFVVAIGESKDAREILRALRVLPGSFIFTSFDAFGRNAIKPQRLAAIAADEGLWGRAISDPVDALEVARRSAHGDEIVIVTGSTFLVARLRAWWFEHVLSNVG